MLKFKSVFSAFFFSLILCCLTSCQKLNSLQRVNLLDKAYIAELPPDVTINQITSYSSTFKRLPYGANNNLSKFITDENNLLWIRIQFLLPTALKDQDLGFFSAYIRAAEKVWINGQYIGEYGQLPPNEFSAGLKSHYFLLPQDRIRRDGTNTLYIQLWAGGTGAISDLTYITNSRQAMFFSEFYTLFNSKIFFMFAGFIAIVSLIFTVTYFSLDRKKFYNYLVFSLLNFCTFFFIVPFFSVETPWVILHQMRYITFLKLFFCIAAYATVYFASSFIMGFIDIPKEKQHMKIRMILFAIISLITLLVPSYKALNSILPVIIVYICIQLSFGIYEAFKAFLNPSRKKAAIQLFSGFIPVALCLFIDIILRFLFKIKHLPYFTFYGWQVTILVFLYYLLRSFFASFRTNIELNEKLLTFNEKLETEVAQRTMELTKTNSILADQITRTNADLMTATLVQQGFMPPKNATFDDWEIAICYKPLSNVSGDLYDYYTTNGKLDGLSLFDVSGHGTSAGLVTMLSKNIINHAFKTGQEQKKSVSEILINVNENIISAKSYTDRYLTGLLFSFTEPDNDDISHGTLANAGHPYPLLYTHKNDEVTEIKCSEPKKQYGIIGLADFEVSFPDINFDMEPGDIMVCFTDGITESTNDFKKQFGTETLKQTIQKFNFHNASKILEIILESLNSFIEKTEVKDDITVIVLKRLPKEKK